MNHDFRSAHRFQIHARALVTLAVMSWIASPCTASQADEPKDNVLFNGTDFIISQGADSFRLVGVGDDTLLVIKGGKTEEIAPVSVTGMRFERGEKLSALHATISKLKSTTIPASGRGGRSPTAVSSLAAPTIEGIEGPTDGLVVTSEPAGNEAFFNRFGYQQDALITFELSAERLMANAYVVVVIGFSEARKDSPLQCKIAFRPVANLGPKPQKVRIIQSGMPKRFDLKGTDVKVYAEGQEVATNLLKQQVALTKSEVHAYFVKSYVSSHEGETAPPRLLMLTPRSALAGRIDKAGLDPQIHVIVDSKGDVLKVEAGEAGDRKISAATSSLLQHIGFMPALDNGAPVEGTLRLDPSKLLP